MFFFICGGAVASEGEGKEKPEAEPFVTGGQVEGAGEEFGALPQARSHEIGLGLVTVITIILVIDKFNTPALKTSDVFIMLFVINIFFFNDLSLNNRREGQESAQEYDVSSELIS